MVILETNIFITKIVFRINILIGFENITCRGKEKMPSRLCKSEVSLYLSKYWSKVWSFLNYFIKYFLMDKVSPTTQNKHIQILLTEVAEVA